MKKVLSLFLLVGMVALFPLMNQAHAAAFTEGDVFASAGGIITEWTPAGVFVQNLNTGHLGEGDGLAFDSAGNLYATAGFSAHTMVKFDSNGNLVNNNFGGGHFTGEPESVVIDNINKVLYVGQPDSGGVIAEFDLNGNFIKNFNAAIQFRGTDWVDLAADLHTIRYTSEGNTIFQFDTATNTQLPNFTSSLPSSPAYAHRILSDGGELVAATNALYRLDSAGNVTKTYTIPGTSLLFAMNLDPDGTSFWTADYLNHEIFRVDIATGTILTQFNNGSGNPLGGLAVFGERTAPTVPLPPSVMLFGSGLLGLAGAGFGRRKFLKNS